MHHSAKEKRSSKMTWIVAPHGSSTDSNLSDSLFTSTEVVVNPQALPILGVEENLREDHDLVILDDEQSDYCIVNKETTEKGNDLLRPNVVLAESSGAVVESHFCFLPFDFSCENMKYIAADAANYYYLSIKDDMVELQYEIDLRRAKNFEIKHVRADGNCLFSAVASQVCGNSKIFDLTRQTCISFMEQIQELFSQLFIEDFASYCVRKRNDKVYGEITELHALAHAYNRPIHIYSYSTEPVNVVHPPCDGNSTPIRLSYHLGNHNNSLVELPNGYDFKLAILLK
uniref:ubiquitinyl hydrolase 1 n=1 Tax=Kalanchoe fedtschenkoi TaxID=63787 RepID=A0A7N0RHE4_KALFE